MRTPVSLVIILLATSSAWTTGHAIDVTSARGSRLRIREAPVAARNKLSVVFSGTGVTNFGIPEPVNRDPRCIPQGSGQASLRVFSPTTGQDFTIDLGGANCSKWSYEGTKYVYRDRSGATCRKILFRTVTSSRPFSAVCRGAQVGYDLGADQVAVNVVLSTGSEPLRNCATFQPTATCHVRNDGSNGTLYAASGACDGPGGPSCPSPSGAFLDDAQLLL